MAKKQALTLPQALILLNISISGSSMSVLANLLGLDPSTVTRNIEKLEVRNLLYREKSILDTRVINVYKSNEGNRISAMIEKEVAFILNNSSNDIPDINFLDLCTAEHYVYQNGSNDSSVELYKVVNGGHTWPGSAIPLFGNNTNQDFNASQKIWEFFNKYDINGLINPNNDINETLILKTLIKKIDILGRYSTNNNMSIYLYNDGSAEKKYLIK